MSQRILLFVIRLANVLARFGFFSNFGLFFFFVGFFCFYFFVSWLSTTLFFLYLSRVPVAVQSFVRRDIRMDHAYYSICCWTGLFFVCFFFFLLVFSFWNLCFCLFWSPRLTIISHRSIICWCHWWCWCCCRCRIILRFVLVTWKLKIGEFFVRGLCLSKDSTVANKVSYVCTCVCACVFVCREWWEYKCVEAKFTGNAVVSPPLGDT